ncbi:hypothetical protein [Parapedobacter lycopersici]|uniref:hypothetical protein n=1 Tax=Parapedobacter lycopersici TaxID=1864939 RepID=UPI00214D453D|nr:hypothetical protein [Parapedobacter lycopersici]
MKSLVKAKPWVVFLLTTVSGWFSNFIIVDYPTMTAMIRILGLAMWAAYPLSLQQAIQDYVPRKVTINENFYLFNGFTWFVSYAIVIILFTNERITFTSWQLLPALYGLFAYFYFMMYPAKVLWCAQRKREARIGEYYGDALLLLILPIGIWFLQPKVKRIMQRELEGESTNGFKDKEQ